MYINIYIYIFTHLCVCGQVAWDKHVISVVIEHCQNSIINTYINKKIGTRTYPPSYCNEF